MDRTTKGTEGVQEKQVLGYLQVSEPGKNGPPVTKAVAITENKTILGRSKDADIRIHHLGVSRLHCELRIEDVAGKHEVTLVNLTNHGTTTVGTRHLSLKEEIKFTEVQEFKMHSVVCNWTSASSPHSIPLAEAVGQEKSADKENVIVIEDDNEPLMAQMEGAIAENDITIEDESTKSPDKQRRENRKVSVPNIDTGEKAENHESPIITEAITSPMAKEEKEKATENQKDDIVESESPLSTKRGRPQPKVSEKNIEKDESLEAKETDDDSEESVIVGAGLPNNLSPEKKKQTPAKKMIPDQDVVTENLTTKTRGKRGKDITTSPIPPEKTKMEQTPQSTTDNDRNEEPGTSKAKRGRLPTKESENKVVPAEDKVIKTKRGRTQVKETETQASNTPVAVEPPVSTTSAKASSKRGQTKKLSALGVQECSVIIKSSPEVTAALQRRQSVVEVADNVTPEKVAKRARGRKKVAPEENVATAENSGRPETVGETKTRGKRGENTVTTASSIPTEEVKAKKSTKPAINDGDNKEPGNSKTKRGRPATKTKESENEAVEDAKTQPKRGHGRPQPSESQTEVHEIVSIRGKRGRPQAKEPEESEIVNTKRGRASPKESKPEVVKDVKIKAGRGRLPPKEVPEAQVPEEVSNTKKRGRRPALKEPEAKEEVEEKVNTRGKRGRPQEEESKEEVADEVKVKRGRGRAQKKEPEEEKVAATVSTRGKRGRPHPNESTHEVEEDAPTKASRGRSQPQKSETQISENVNTRAKRGRPQANKSEEERDVLVDPSASTSTKGPSKKGNAKARKNIVVQECKVVIKSSPEVSEALRRREAAAVRAENETPDRAVPRGRGRKKIPEPPTVDADENPESSGVKQTRAKKGKNVETLPPPEKTKPDRKPKTKSKEVEEEVVAPSRRPKRGTKQTDNDMELEDVKPKRGRRQAKV